MNEILRLTVMKRLITFLFVLVPFLSFAQYIASVEKSISEKDSTISLVKGKGFWSDPYPAIKIGYMRSKYNSLEIGIQRIRFLGTKKEYYGLKGLSLGTDFLFDHGIVVGPKISTEANILIFGTRLNATYYTDFKTGSFKIRPEIGLTFFGIVNILYGRTINCSNPAFCNQKHSISAFLNYPVISRNKAAKAAKNNFFSFDFT